MASTYCSSFSSVIIIKRPVSQSATGILILCYELWWEAYSFAYIWIPDSTFNMCECVGLNVL